MKLSEIEGFPTEVALSVENLDAAISVFEKSVSELVSTSLVDAHSNLKPLDRARYDTASIYSVTSLYWAFMKTKGIDPKAHGMLKELERVKDAVTRAKQIADRELAPKVDISAAKRFIRQGLWEPSKDDQSGKKDSTTSLSTDEPSPPKRICTDKTNAS